ncbi:hypothetical protein [Oryzifoliimicrobium ureilyticus]|uniref:hypothetical protein n=1 Tax=Oryzifoliimicrobium ureilyticus TaxID=3113724 RepID=UPI0030765243
MEHSFKDIELNKADGSVRELSVDELGQVAGGVPYADGRDYGGLGQGTPEYYPGATSIWIYGMRYAY